MGGCTSTSLKIPSEKKFRRAIKLYDVTEVTSLTNLFNRNKCFESGESPLTLAAQEGHEAVVEVLIDSGADVNMLDRNGRAPMHVATHLHDVETVRILLDSHADPNKHDDYHNCAPLHVACERGYTDIVQLLVTRGADVNDSSTSLAPLVFAVAHKQTECVEILLQHGADPDCEDARGNSVLHVAVSNADAATAKALMDGGANIDARSRDNDSLVPLAAMLNSHETLQVLLEAGCDVNKHKPEEPHALIASCVHGNSENVELLIASGVDVTAEDKRKQTALQIACLAMTDTERQPYYCRYFSNVYRQFSRFDPDAVVAENNCKCAMTLVQNGADLSRVWPSFARVFPDDSGAVVTFEQMVLCEVLMQAFGFMTLDAQLCRDFCAKLLRLNEFGLVKLLYSAGVDPTLEELTRLALSNDTEDRKMFAWTKQLVRHPRTLKDLCRKQVRRSLSWNVLYLVEQVPQLSTELKDYVCIMDTEHYSVSE